MLGVTPPIKSDLPTREELDRTAALLEELKRQKTFESPAETNKREQVLSSLENICNEFVKRVAREKDPENELLIRNAIGRVFTYGSYRLKVYGPGSDIDTLVVAPRYVNRDDYFKHFPNLLLEMAPEGAITGLTPVEGAFVPIIKFEYSGISIDLIFSRIMQKQLSPDLNLKDSSILRGLDEQELRSVNGTRVTDEILDLVPELSTFRTALRAIKLWAQRRAVYANIMGFPGGVAWAMLVARICQLYPRATAAVVVNRFFVVVSRWPWPKPCLLKDIEEGPLPVRIWNPEKNFGDRKHLMPIITPAYPSMCATFNVTHSSKAVIQRELERGFELTEKIMTKKEDWKALFDKHTFFTQGYKHYICVISTSRNKEAHKLWSGLVESKVRMLVQKLEVHRYIQLAHAFVKGYERRHKCRSYEEIEQVQENCLDYVAGPDEPENPPEEPAQQAVGEDGAATKDSASVTNGEAHAIKADAQLNGTMKKEEDDDQPTNHDAPAQTATADPEMANGQGTETATPAPAPAVKVEPRPDRPLDVYTMTHYIGLELAKDTKQLDLAYETNEFRRLCESWPKYTEDLQDLSTVSVKHCRNFDLPDDVFEPGEKKPAKKGKKAGAAKSTPGGVKREATEEHSQPPPAKRQQSSLTAAG